VEINDLLKLKILLRSNVKTDWVSERLPDNIQPGPRLREIKEFLVSRNIIYSSRAWVRESAAITRPEELMIPRQ